MNGEFFFSANISSENLKELSSKQLMLTERRICEIAEMAADAVSYSKGISDADIYEMLSFVSEDYKNIRYKLYENVIFQNTLRIERYAKTLSSMDKAYFAALYTELMSENGVNIRESDFLQSSDSDESFVYVKNVYADEAYDVFSQDFSDPRVRYAGSLREAAKFVADGISAYCILPLEESGARLASVAEILYRFDLKINAVIPVFGIDGTADIKYALVSRHFTVPVRDIDDDRYLEIRIADRSSPSLSELLCAAESYGVKVYRVNSLSFDVEGEMRGYYSVVFSGEDVDFTELLVYLTLFASDHTIVGIYKNLES